MSNETTAIQALPTQDRHFRLTFQSITDETIRTDVSRGVDGYEAAELHGGFHGYELSDFREIDVATFDDES